MQLLVVNIQLNYTVLLAATALRESHTFHTVHSYVFDSYSDQSSRADFAQHWCVDRVGHVLIHHHCTFSSNSDLFHWPKTTLTSILVSLNCSISTGVECCVHPLWIRWLLRYDCTAKKKKKSICSEEVDSEKSSWRCSVNLIAANLKKAIWSKNNPTCSRCTNSHISVWRSSQKNKCNLRDPIKSKHKDVHNIDHLGYSSTEFPNRRRQTRRLGRRWKKGGGFSELGPNSA